MYCHNCGYHNSSDACFCNNCGEKLFSLKNQTDGNEHMSNTVKKRKEYKLIILVIIAVLIPLFSLPMFLLPASVLPIVYFFSESNEVPKQYIEAFVEDMYDNEDFKITKIKHDYNSDLHIDYVTVELKLKRQYAEQRHEISLEYLHKASDDLWTLINDETKITYVKWNKNILTTWTGEDYSITIHSIDSSDPANMKVTCSYVFERYSGIGDNYHCDYRYMGANETYTIGFMNMFIIEKTSREFYVTVDAELGVSVKDMWLFN